MGADTRGNMRELEAIFSAVERAEEEEEEDEEEDEEGDATKVKKKKAGAADVEEEEEEGDQEFIEAATRTGGLFDVVAAASELAVAEGGPPEAAPKAAKTGTAEEDDEPRRRTAIGGTKPSTVTKAAAATDPASTDPVATSTTTTTSSVAVVVAGKPVSSFQSSSKGSSTTLALGGVSAVVTLLVRSRIRWVVNRMAHTIRRGLANTSAFAVRLCAATALLKDLLQGLPSECLRREAGLLAPVASALYQVSTCVADPESLPVTSDYSLFYLVELEPRVVARHVAATAKEALAALERRLTEDGRAHEFAQTLTEARQSVIRRKRKRKVEAKQLVTLDPVLAFSKKTAKSIKKKNSNQTAKRRKL
eukprot:GHVU01220256.1.p1 GENE.GHVU01220256.1~~GHVU01220256.1.p1  ORF type:complete len:363 (+),score=96.59 GHVU01220256.1:300-1388(+)